MPYTTSAATGGLGTKLSVETVTSPSTFTEIDEVGQVDTPTIDKPRYDVTNMQSTSKEYIGSRLPDPQEISYEANWVASTTQEQIITDSYTSTNTVRNFKIEHFEDDGTTAVDEITFSGYYKGGVITAPVDGPKKLKFTIVVTGNLSSNVD
jgi:hypothetical protein